MTGLLRPTAAQLKRWRSLKGREARAEQGLYLAEGEHLTEEALREGAAQALLCQEDRQERYAALLNGGLPCYLVPARAFQQLSDTRTPQGIAALCHLPDNSSLTALGPRILALEGLQDPGNVGTILRTMDAANFTGLMLDRACADVYSPKALRASMGAAFRLPVRLCENLPEDLQALSGFAILAGSLQGSPFYERPALGARLCLLIGNEGAGLSEELQALATHRLKLPMPGRAESLNAAVAAGIMMYDFVRTGDAG